MVISHSEEIPLASYLWRAALMNRHKETCIGNFMVILFLMSEIRDSPRSLNRRLYFEVGTLYKVIAPVASWRIINYFVRFGNPNT